MKGCARLLGQQLEQLALFLGGLRRQRMKQVGQNRVRVVLCGGPVAELRLLGALEEQPVSLTVGLPVPGCGLILGQVPHAGEQKQGRRHPLGPAPRCSRAFPDGGCPTE